MMQLQIERCAICSAVFKTTEQIRINYVNWLEIDSIREWGQI